MQRSQQVVVFANYPRQFQRIRGKTKHSESAGTDVDETERTLHAGDTVPLCGQCRDLDRLVPLPTACRCARRVITSAVCLTALSVLSRLVSM